MSGWEIGIAIFVVLVITAFLRLFYLQLEALKNKMTSGDNQIKSLIPKQPILITMNDLPLPPKASTCTHAWSPVSDQIIKSSVDEKHIIILSCLSCGCLDKTITTTTLPTPALPPIGECRHQWKIKTDVHTPSPIEQVTGILVQLQAKYATEAQRKLIKGAAERLQESIPANPEEWHFKRSVLQVRECTECGKIHTITNYENGDYKECET